MDLLNPGFLFPIPATVLLTLLTLYLALTHLARQKHHPSEPPIVPPLVPLPYIGHLLGMILQGGHYIKTLGIRNLDKPIFTLVVPFSRLYIVTSPSLAAAIQRRPAKQLSFNALLPDITQRVMGLDQETRAIVSKGLDPGRGEEKGFLAELHDMLVSFLGRGTELEDLTLRSVRELSEALDHYTDQVLTNDGTVTDGDSVEEELLPWVRHLVTHATARLLYGTRNPFARHHGQEDLEQAFWDFDHGLGRLLLGIFPSVTAAKAYRAREKLVAAFREYIELGHYEPEAAAAEDGGNNSSKKGEGASQIILNRIRIARSHGFESEGIARSELSFLFAGIVNTATTTFWTLVRIFADRQLLHTIRTELEAAALGGDAGVAAADERGGSMWSARRQISVSTLARDGATTTAACPTLYAVYREVLRLGSNNFSTRLVQSDTILTAAGPHDGEYFLRSGGIVQIAGGVMHADTSIWGKDAAQFDPSRHLHRQKRDKDKENDNGSAVHPAAFRSFGGGRTMCPGRHFASGEILGLVAMIVLRFEIEGIYEGCIKVPELDDYILPVHILEPLAGSPVRVRLKLRGGGDGRPVEAVA